MTRAVGAGLTPLVVVVLPCWSTCVCHKSQEAAQVRDKSPLEFKSFRWASNLLNLEFRSIISNSRASILLWKKLLSAIRKGDKEIVWISGYFLAAGEPSVLRGDWSKIRYPDAGVDCGWVWYVALPIWRRGKITWRETHVPLFRLLDNQIDE